MRRWLLMISLIIFLMHSAGAQLLPFKKYTTKDGLDSKIVNSVVRDKRGLLWVGTPFAINWFDGTKFYQPTVPRKVSQLFIQRFYKDKEGNIWTLTFYNGFYKFQNEHFKQFLIDSAYAEINKNNVMDMTEIDSSHYVVATDGGAYLFNGKNFNRIDSKNLDGQIGTVVFTNGYLLAGNGRGLFCYQYDGQWKFIAKSIDGISVNRILFKDGHLWLATDKGLYYFEHFDFTKTNQPTTIYLKNQQVFDVTSNAANEIWFNAKGFVYKLDNKQLTEYNWSSGLSAPSTQIYFDEQNTAWFSTREGLYKLSEEYYSFQEREPYGVASFIKADGKIWMSYRAGFSDVSQKISYHFPDESKTTFTVLYYAPISKKFWATNESGIFLWENNQLHKKFSIQCSDLYEDDNGTTWISTNDDKLFIYKNDKLQPVKFYSFPNDFISNIFKDEKNFLWLGFRTGGVIKYQIKDSVLETVKEFSSKTGFPDLRIRSCHADGKGNILFGTRSNGLFIFSLSNDNRYWHIINNNDFNATWIRAMDVGDSSIYLATNNGVFILKAEANYSHPKINAVNFSNEEISKEINCILADGQQVWIGANGLIHFFPQKLPKDTAAPPVFITQVSVEGKADSNWIPYSHQQTTLHLPYNKNVIAFEFSGVHLKDEYALNYRYKLEGQDKDWSARTNRNFVSYNLPPGHYRFLVQAENSGGVWSKNFASYSFIIAQPFWMTWWFIALIIVMAMMLVYLIYHYRLKQAMKLERLRYKISTDLHDDIGSTLSSISILSDMALTEHNPSQNEAMVAEIKESSLNLMEKMDDIVWSINPKNDSLGSLLLRIKRFSSRLFEARDIDYSIDIDKAVAEIKLPMEYRQHIYLILKEAINNLVKYSNATKATIEVNLVHSVLKIRISDNGKGFDLNSAHLGNGIISMKSRAAIMKANLKIETYPNEGTTLRLDVKIK